MMWLVAGGALVIGAIVGVAGVCVYFAGAFK